MSVGTRVQLRRDTAADWTSANPTLLAGEFGIETDTLKFKIGTGSTAWNTLAYATTGSGGGGTPSGTAGGDLSGTYPNPTVSRVNGATLGSAAFVATSTFDAAGAASTEATRAQAAEALLALKASPTFTGTVTVPTPTAGDNTTKAASTAFVTTALSGVGGASLPAVNSTPVTAAGALPVSRHTPVDATAGTISMTLPTGQSAGTLISAEKFDATVNTVTITGNIRDVAGTTLTLALQHETVLLEADSSGSWWPLVGHKTLSSLDARYASIYSVTPQTITGASGVVNIDVSQGWDVNIAQTGNITGFHLENVPAATDVIITLKITSDSGTHTITLTSGDTINFVGGGTPSFISGAGAYNELQLSTDNGGTTIRSYAEFTQAQADARYLTSMTVATQNLVGASSTAITPTVSGEVYEGVLTGSAGTVSDITLSGTSPGWIEWFLLTQDSTGGKTLSINTVNVPLGSADTLPGAIFKVHCITGSSGKIYPSRV